MAAGNKKEKIELYNLIPTRTITGAVEEKYYLRYKLYAEVGFNQNTIQLINDEIVQTDRITFRIYNRKIQYTDKVVWRDTEYSIISINPLSYTNEIILICEKINK